MLQRIGISISTSLSYSHSSWNDELLVQTHQRGCHILRDLRSSFTLRFREYLTELMSQAAGSFPILLFGTICRMFRAVWRKTFPRKIYIVTRLLSVDDVIRRAISDFTLGEAPFYNCAQNNCLPTLKWKIEIEVKILKLPENEINCQARFGMFTCLWP